ncbi:cytochrome P450 [Boletus edulis]|nr:cytochrome P450 [Boletus edulis]
MIYSSAGAGIGALILIFALFRRFTRPSLSVIRGPQSPSFIFGNLLELFQRPVGEADFAWQSQYGNIVRFKSVLGEDRLLVTDPEALRRMLNTSTQTYSKLPNYRIVSRMLHGTGLLWADGEDHRRQRSIMLPGFGMNECKEFLPIFKDCAEAISMKWLETIGSSDSRGLVIDVLAWASRGTLDAMGHAAFDVQFGAIEDDLHPLAKKYKNYLGDIFGLPSSKQIFLQAASKYIPACILQWLLENGSNTRLVRARDVRTTVTSIAKELVREKADTLLQGRGNTDIFTLLVKANMDANAKKKLSDEELLAQMRTLLISGYETTSTAVVFILLELARHPKVQSKLRDEIRKTEATIRARGDPQLTVADLEAMTYLNAVVKEGLRLHPPAPHSLRIARQEDILPLSKPIITESGDMINKVFVPKGTEIVISIAAYNRDKSLWGENAHEFNPDRWLDGEMDDKNFFGIGAYSNLMTFFSGTRACLGWRFALIEIQVFLFTLVGKFEFAVTDKSERIVRQSVIAMVPMVDGELDRGVQLPLSISLASQDGEM